MSSQSNEAEASAGLLRVQRIKDLLGDLDLVASSMDASIACRLTIPAPIAYLPLLTRTTSLPWKEVHAALLVEFGSNIPTVYGCPLGLQMVVEAIRRASVPGPEDQKAVGRWLERLLVAGVVQRCASV